MHVVDGVRDELNQAGTGEGESEVRIIDGCSMQQASLISLSKQSMRKRLEQSSTRHVLLVETSKIGIADEGWSVGLALLCPILVT